VSAGSQSRAALVLALVAVVLAATGVAQSAGTAVRKALRPGGVLRLDRHAKVPVAALPKVRAAKNADALAGKTTSSPRAAARIPSISAPGA
jgi:nitrous oxidase accessory protein NosD